MMSAFEGDGGSWKSRRGKRGCLNFITRGKRVKQFENFADFIYRSLLTLSTSIGGCGDCGHGWVPWRRVGFHCDVTFHAPRAPPAYSAINLISSEFARAFIGAEKNMKQDTV